MYSRLREKNDNKFLSDRRAGSLGSLRVSGGSAVRSEDAKKILSESLRTHPVLSETQSAGSEIASQENAFEASEAWYKNQSVEILCTT